MAPIEDKDFKYSRIKLGKEQLRGAEEFLEKQSVKYINELAIKEKAKELVVGFKKYAESDWLNSDLLKQKTISNTILFNAKQCALIAVDEIINACEYNRVESCNTDWWNKVKIEINKLLI